MGCSFTKCHLSFLLKRCNTTLHNIGSFLKDFGWPQPTSALHFRFHGRVTSEILWLSPADLLTVSLVALYLFLLIFCENFIVYYNDSSNDILYYLQLMPLESSANVWKIHHSINWLFYEATNWLKRMRKHSCFVEFTPANFLVKQKVIVVFNNMMNQRLPADTEFRSSTPGDQTYTLISYVSLQFLDQNNFNLFYKGFNIESPFTLRYIIH